MGESHKRVSFWDGVLERVKSRLGRWKGRFLLLAGRVCLIKSVLSAIPLFYLSVYKLPVAVLKEFEKVQRRFLWGWGDEGRKVAWVSWRKVCEPREAGGLGILNLRFFNAALLGKWIWRLETEKDGLWKEILESKYGGWRNLQEQRSNAKDSSWWRDLKGVWGMEDWGKSFENCCEWRVGDGKDILFWKDVWVGNEDLKSKFPRLFSLCGNKEGSLQSCGE